MEKITDKINFAHEKVLASIWNEGIFQEILLVQSENPKEKLSGLYQKSSNSKIMSLLQEDQR